MFFDQFAESGERCFLNPAIKFHGGEKRAVEEFHLLTCRTTVKGKNDAYEVYLNGNWLMRGLLNPPKKLGFENGKFYRRHSLKEPARCPCCHR